MGGKRKTSIGRFHQSSVNRYFQSSKKRKVAARAPYDPKKNYCGPGRFTIPASKKVNYLCYKHDMSYKTLKNYFFNGRGDTRLRRDLSRLGGRELGVAGYVARTFFRAKREMAPNMTGITPVGKPTASLGKQHGTYQAFRVAPQKAWTIREEKGIQVQKSPSQIPWQIR